eukprot:scaffold2992_cov103-Skeletonema_marinoi.AAC.4
MTSITRLLALVASLAVSSPIAYAYSLFNKSAVNNDELNPKANRVEPPSPSNLFASNQQQVVSSGSFHTCAITHRNGISCSGGEKKCGPVKCWGHNNHGQTSTPPGLVLTDVSAGGFFTCGLKVGGEAICWGEIDHPPRSVAELEESLSRDELSNLYHAQRMNRGKGGPSTLNGGDYYDQISSGMKHACAATRDDEVHCWGRNDYGESTPPSGKFVHVSTSLAFFDHCFIHQTSFSHTLLKVSAGNSFTCGLRPNGAAECWGKNDVGQSSPPPYPKNIFTHVSASIGGDHACGILLQGGGIRCWGNNARGQSEQQDGTFLHISAGTRTTCGVEVKSETTSIHCWGGRANALLDQVDLQRNERRLALESSGYLDDGVLMEERLLDDSSNYHYQHISLGQDHGCASIKLTDDASSSSSSSLECWWMTGSDFDAHRVPVGLELIVMA